MRSDRVRGWDLLALGQYLCWNQALIFPGTDLRDKEETYKKARNARIFIRPAESEDQEHRGS